MTDKLNIKYEMAMFDSKNREFFDDLTEEEQKKFSPFLMIRWGSSVDGPIELQEYYLLSANERLNKNFFDVSTTNHKKFQWLLATTVSPDMGNMYHSWISAKKQTKDTSQAKLEKLVSELYPELNPDEVKLMAKINDKTNLRDIAISHGWDDKRIKQYL